MEKELSVTQYFQADHDRLDGLLKQFQANKRKDFQKAKSAFRDFFFGLKRHIAWEEQVLFPAFEEKTGMKDSGPTAVMRLEHEQIKQALDAIHERVRRADPESDRDEGILLEVLTQHNVKEEGVLYPAIDRLLSDQERKAAFQKIKAISENETQSCCGLTHH